LIKEKVKKFGAEKFDKGLKPKELKVNDED